MKRFISFIAITLAIVVSSCSKFDDTDIWNKLNDHEKRIVSLEELCKQMNTNISSLQSIVNALQKNDYITNVSPVRKDGEEIGYTITFAYGDTITIYHGTNGKDGANGKDGKDGYTPQIGVMKDTDGIYYWTVDGEWLLDGKGNKIQANGVNGTDGTNGSNGQDGTNGTNGKDGADGVTPRLKIENDYWYVSYDNGATWTELGKATGEDGSDGANGSDGADGEDGDSIFKSVTQDDEYVYFNLADGTMITLPKHDKENIQFEDLQVKAICCKNWDTNNDGELSYAEAAAVTTIGTKFKGSSIIAFNELKYFTGITEIPDEAFSGCSSLWKIAMTNNITTIGEKAFYNSAIRTISLPNSILTIKSNAFAKSAIEKIIIPNSVTSIGSYAFSECSKLVDISLSDNIVSIEEYTFSDCTSLSEISIPNSITTIGAYAFSGCNRLLSITIPDSVTSLKEYTFANCSANIFVPNSVVQFGNSVFEGCTGTLTINNKIIETDYTSNTSVSENKEHHLYGSKFSTIILGEVVQHIGNYAFYKYNTLQKIIASSQCISFGEYAFYHCDSLAEVKFSSIEANEDHMFEIGGYAFAFCSALSTSPIHNNVASIGTHAFYKCTSIISITIPAGVEYIGSYAFSGCTGELEVNCTNVSPKAFAQSAFSKIVINNHVNIIDESAFANIDNITEIVIPDSVTRIEYGAFQNCDQLTKITIGKNVTYIGQSALYSENGAISTIYSKAVTPPTLVNIIHNSQKVFFIYVPTESVSAYKSTSYWSRYKDYIFAYDFE